MFTVVLRYVSTFYKLAKIQLKNLYSDKVFTRFKIPGWTRSMENYVTFRRVSGTTKFEVEDVGNATHYFLMSVNDNNTRFPVHYVGHDRMSVSTGM